MFKGLYKYNATTYNTIRYCIYTLIKKFIAATDSGGPPWGLREEQNMTEVNLFVTKGLETSLLHVSTPFEFIGWT